MRFNSHVSPDKNDVDRDGLDSRSRKRLGIKPRRSKKPKPPIRPNVPGNLRFEESTLRKRSYDDTVLDVFKKYLYSVNQFSSTAGKIEKAGSGYISSGTWPNQQRPVLKWELEVYKQSRDFIISVGVWDINGNQIGDNFRVSQSNHDKFLKNRFHLYIDEMISSARKEYSK